MKVYSTLLVLILISQPGYGQPCVTPPTISFNQNTIDICPGESATPVAAAIGTVGTVHFTWFPGGASTNSITVSPTVNTWYYLEVTDDCFTILDSMKVEVHPVVVTSINVTDATNCPGQPGSLGSVSVFPVAVGNVYTLTGGGTINGPQTSNNFTNLPGGVTYFMNIENSEGCTIDTAIHVGLGANAVIANWVPASLADVTCFGDNNGEAEIINIGGGINPPFTVTWTHSTGLHETQTGLVSGQGDATTNLFGGDWVVTVKDQEGCAWSQFFNIFEPGDLTIGFYIENPTCHGFSDGSITAVPNGGNGSNTFVITNSSGTQINGGNSSTSNGITAGWYYVSITDSEGCSVSDSAFIDEPGLLAIDLIATDPLCADDANGSIVVDTVYNFNGNYYNIDYYWIPNPSGINGNGATSNINLTSGNYQLIINDQNGCSNSFDITLSSPDPLYFIELGSEAFSTTQDGVVYCAAAGGTPGYTYTWTNLTTLVTSNSTTWGGLSTGYYQIEVVDANGCVLIDTVYVGYLNTNEINLSESLRVYPTLVNDAILNVDNQLQTNCIFVIYTTQGEKVFEDFLQNGKNEFHLNLTSGAYFYQIFGEENKIEILNRGKISVVN
jgi:hypothetical protein